MSYATLYRDVTSHVTSKVSKRKDLQLLSTIASSATRAHPLRIRRRDCVHTSEQHDTDASEGVHHGPPSRRIRRLARARPHRLFGRGQRSDRSRRAADSRSRARPPSAAASAGERGHHGHIHADSDQRLHAGTDGLGGQSGRVLIGLYRFDATTQLVLDPLQTFTLDIRYRDEKGEYQLPDEGEFKAATPPGDGLGLTFSSAIYGDKFTGAASDGMIGISYDFDGDGRLDTVFLFRRVGG